MSLIMYDAVEAANIPLNAEAAAFYPDGRYANEAAVRARMPGHLLSITVAGAEADACDCEVGDLTVAQAEDWVKRMLAAGRYRPCVYANADRWENQGLKTGLAHYGAQIRRWVAAYDNTPTIPPGYDAHQYSSTQTLDTSVLLANFFDPKPPPPGQPTGTARFEGSIDLGTGEWIIHGLPGAARFAGPERWASAEVQLDVGQGGGRWRVRGLPWNAPPLGGV